MMKITRGVKIFNVFNVVFMILFSLTIILPFLAILSNSLRSSSDILKNGYRLFPEKIELESYVFLFVDSNRIINGYKTSIFITMVGTFLSILLTAMMAYALSKKWLHL